jgi:hypothetical protein
MKKIKIICYEEAMNGNYSIDGKIDDVYCVADDIECSIGFFDGKDDVWYVNKGQQDKSWYFLQEEEKDCNILGCQCGGECKESPRDDKEEDDIKEGDKFKVMQGKPQIDGWEYHPGDIYEVLDILNPVIRSKINGEIKQHLHDGLLVKVSPREYKEEEMNSYKCKSCDCVVDTFVDIEDEDNFLCPNCLEKARIKVFSLDAGVEKESPFERRDIRPEEQTDISGFPIKHDLESIKASQERGQMSTEQGQKHDGGKAQWHLLPWDALKEVVKVLMFGANKYNADNWKIVPGARQRYFDAAIRHITDWFSGKRKVDEESGLNSLAHAICCLIFLLWFDLNSKENE